MHVLDPAWDLDKVSGKKGRVHYHAISQPIVRTTKCLVLLLLTCGYRHYHHRPATHQQTARTQQYTVHLEPNPKNRRHAAPQENPKCGVSNLVKRSGPPTPVKFSCGNATEGTGQHPAKGRTRPWTSPPPHASYKAEYPHTAPFYWATTSCCTDMYKLCSSVSPNIAKFSPLLHLTVACDLSLHDRGAYGCFQLLYTVTHTCMKSTCQVWTWKTRTME
ncbi:hypothetical protein BDB00DRAFT_648481 [Zychaea mexicana]|uniref:uncharacterized protein n=1 Tax=Zychaea mexicana TaxID=64656 RepID=UPI0022FF1A57|nr:uncharacterized protein BDB00DRAFT_648481 [Zychaea mexicana]KAI9488916.1 hypothetical protein BDB00DRAFT_648481 [Zychaea mexicana]